MVKSKKIILNDRIIKNNLTIPTIISTEERNKKQYYSQYELEYSAEKINEQMDKLMSLNIGELSLILSKLKKLGKFKTRWIDIINQIVSYCENNINLNDIKDDLGKMMKCIEYINSKYEYFFKHEILNLIKK